jgi:hypothetical protein
MALTGTHTNWQNGSYRDDRDEQIKLRENDLLYESRNNQTPRNLKARVREAILLTAAAIY